jgi:arabinogalactan endo-1,4-beta-galactosidase
MLLLKKQSKYYFKFFASQGAALTIFLMLVVVLVSSCSKPVKEVNTPDRILSIKSADASMLPQIRSSGLSIKNRDGQLEDMLLTLKKEGVNTIRLRLWKDPANEHSGFAEVKTLAQEIKNNGLKVWLSVHYSDTWADPGSQLKPAAWNGINFTQLKDSVYNYSKKIITEINPEYIQVGNEINAGFLWPEGNIANLAQMKDLLNQAIKAVRDNALQTKIMLHYAGHENAADFYSNLSGLDFDIIALSYYPLWHGKNLDLLQASLISLGTQFNKPIIIAETAYPFTLQWNDYTNNIIGSSNQILPEYPATSQGQKDFLSRIKKIVTNSPKGIGFCYWGAEWIAYKGSLSTNGSPWENQALWDFNNQALPAIGIFKD